MIVLDTNVVSELMRPEPSAAVSQWVLARDGRDLYTTAVTVAEVRYGIERMPGGRRKELLRATVAEVFGGFSEQVLPFDKDAGSLYATVVSGRDNVGRPIDGFDAQIAAICRARMATLATRNVKDFLDTGIDIVDPWEADVQ